MSTPSKLYSSVMYPAAMNAEDTPVRIHYMKNADTEYSIAEIFDKDELIG